MDKHGAESTFKHDGILTLVDLGLDIIVMETEGDRKQNYEMSDLEKLGRALSKNLCQAMENVLSEDWVHLRTHGIFFSGFKVTLIEARLIDGFVVVYSVGQYPIPKGVAFCNMLAEVLLVLVGFKRRIERNNTTIQQNVVAKGRADNWPTSK